MSENWNYEVRHNSSVDRIERAMKFYRAAADFLELLDLDAENQSGQAALRFLQAEAMRITQNESKDAGN